MKIISKILLTALALFVVDYLIPGIEIDTLKTAIIAAVVLGVLNLIAKPVLVVLTLPITIVTLGLFMFVVNAVLFLLASSIVDGFVVDGFFLAVVGSFGVSVISAAGSKFI